MKLSLPEIREESFEVKTSIKNIKKNACLPIGTSKKPRKTCFSSGWNTRRINQSNRSYDMSVINNAEKFITEILGLNKKEVDKLQEFDRGQFMNLQSKLVLSLQGYDDDQIDTMFTEEVDSAEKKVQALKNEKSTTTTN